ncbi:metallophosphatase [uncultured Bacteroides sp.]|uniref:bifunctional metallophosphatase/5'-nucleotidase n=1 Tax=uncultured Bacteroides sp. TaxID=162156 RepID=UPI002AA66629|nr:metallophosphatase [uncultured Bacteroides sp.]
MKKQNLSTIHNPLLVVGLLLCISLSSFAQRTKTITILHTNDTHSRIEPVEANSPDTRLADKGGFVRRATCIDQIRKEKPDLLLFDSGDFSQGTPYYNLFKGEVEIKLMNSMGYDAATIGNHEFDCGLDNMARLFRMANFPIVCANYGVEGTVLEGLVKPYVIIEREGLKIGVFGLSPKLEGLVQAEKCEGVVYKDPIKTANEMAAFLKKEKKCDAVVCLSHLGYKPSSADNPACDVNLVRETSNIDVVLGGHSHTFLAKPAIYLNDEGKSIPITQMGSRGVYVGRMDLIFEKK